MSPYKQRGGRSYQFDRQFKGLRVHLSSGTDRLSLFRLMDAMLTQLSQTGRGLALLHAIARREVTPLQVWAAYQANRLDSLPTGALARPLVEAVRAWREATKPEVSDDTYRVRAELVRAIERHASVGAKVADLPDALRRLRESSRHAPVGFRLNRAYALAFVRDTLGKHHPLHTEVAAVPGFPQPRRRAEVAGHSLTPAQAVELLQHLGGNRRAVAVGMLLTGMNPKEYWGSWTVRADRVHVEGTKRGARIRDVPRAFPSDLWPHHTLTRPSESWHPTFQRAFRVAARAVGVPYTPYSLRRSFAVWMEEAGIVRARRNIYRGHEARDIGDLYERQEVKDRLTRDGQRLVAWINEQLAGCNALEALAQ